MSSLQSMISLASLFPVKLTLSNFTNLRKSLSVELSSPDMAMLAHTASLHLHSCYISLLMLGLELITTVLPPEQTEKNNANTPLCLIWEWKMWVTLILCTFWLYMEFSDDYKVWWFKKNKATLLFDIDLVNSKCHLITSIFVVNPFPYSITSYQIGLCKVSDSFHWNVLPCFHRMIVFFTTWKQWVP